MICDILKTMKSAQTILARETTAARDQLVQSLVAYRQGDPEGFRLFYKFTHKAVFALLRGTLPSSEAAEDALQDVYLKIHRHLRMWDETRGAMAWVLAIARHVAIDHLRRVRPSTTWTEEMVGPERPIDPTTRLAIEEILKGLTTREENLLIARCMAESSYDELAKEFGGTPQTLRKQISRLLSTLRKRARHT